MKKKIKEIKIEEIKVVFVEAPVVYTPTDPKSGEEYMKSLEKLS